MASIMIVVRAPQTQTTAMLRVRAASTKLGIWTRCIQGSLAKKKTENLSQLLLSPDRQHIWQAYDETT